MTLTKRKTQFLPAIQYWLFASAMMVLCMAVIGAVTRLTESGLSMVEWRPLIGALPPLSAEEWQRVYDLYKQSPEFEHKHYWMSLAEFKNIFFWEWFHRVWGRLIGLVYALPLAYFWIRKMIPTGYKKPLLGLLFLQLLYTLVETIILH
jgi:cytochrome c oxidase assembly protein subunit 15